MNMLYLFYKWKTTNTPRLMCSQFLGYFSSCPSQWNREKLVKKWLHHPWFLLGALQSGPFLHVAPETIFFVLITIYLPVSRFNVLFSTLIKLALPGISNALNFFIILRITSSLDFGYYIPPGYFSSFPGCSFWPQFLFFFMDFVIHWNVTDMGLHVFPIPIPPPTSLSTRSL